MFAFPWRTTSVVALLCFVLVGCGGSSSSSPGSPSQTFTCIGTNEFSTPDPAPFIMLRSFPACGATGVDPNATLVVFFDDLINPATVSPATLVVTRKDGSPVAGTYQFAASSGATVMFFQPSGGFPANDTITVHMPTNGMMDDDPDSIAVDTTISFATGAPFAGGAALAASLNFDGGPGLPTGVQCAGDCGVRNAFGNAGPVAGNAAYISTAEHDTSFNTTGLVSATPALGDATSMLVVHALDVTGKTGISFTYDFVSDEFPEFVNAGFNDVFLLVMTGPNGTSATVVDSVDLVNTAAVDGTFPGMPVDSYVAQHSMQKTFSTTLGVGSPVTLYLVVSDVGDTIYPTVVMIDNITLTP